jgi:hypothetical protein
VPVGEAVRAWGAALSHVTLRGLLARCLIWFGLFAVYHKVLRHLIRGGLVLGYVIPAKVAPLYSTYAPARVSLWLIPPCAVLVGLLFVSRLRPTWLLDGWRAAVPVLVTFCAFAPSVAMVDGYQQTGHRLPWGPQRALPALLVPYAHKGHEYFGDVRKVDKIGGVRVYLGEYAGRVQDSLSLHGSTHPPGAIVFLWAVSRPFGYSLWAGAIATLLVSVLGGAAGYALLRLVDPGAAAPGLLMWIVTPSVVLFTCTSMDAVFAAVLVAAMTAMYWSILGPAASRPWRGALAGVVVAASLFLTYTTFVLGVLALVVLLLSWRFDRGRLPAMLSAGGWALASCVTCYVLLYVLTGFDPIATFRVALVHNAALMGPVRGVGQYLHITLAQVVAFLMGLGLPLAALWPAALGERFADLRCGSRDPGATLAVGAAAAIILFSALGLYRMEVERIWMFMIPLAILPVAHTVRGRPKMLLAVVALLGLQTIIAEALLDTRW